MQAKYKNLWEIVQILEIPSTTMRQSVNEVVLLFVFVVAVKATVLTHIRNLFSGHFTIIFLMFFLTSNSPELRNKNKGDYTFCMLCLSA